MSLKVRLSKTKESVQLFNKNQNFSINQHDWLSFTREELVSSADRSGLIRFREVMLEKKLSKYAENANISPNLMVLSILLNAASSYNPPFSGT